MYSTLASDLGWHERLRLVLTYPGDRVSQEEGHICRQERQKREAKNPHNTSRFSGALSGSKGYYGRGHFSRHVQSSLQTSCGAPVSHDSYGTCQRQSLFSAPLIYGSQSASLEKSSFSIYSGHQGKAQTQKPHPPRGYFECGDLGHNRNYYPRHQRSLFQQGTHALVPAPVAMTTKGGAQPGRGHLRGGGQTCKGQVHCYSFLSRPQAVTSDAVIGGIVSVYHKDALVSFDRGSAYSYVSSYFASYLGMSCSSLDIFVYLCTLVGDSIMIDQIGRAHV